ncbi:MAG: zf-HC2 domain-containing protein [Bacillota bacterium]|jgi:hypothetical protein
MKPTECNLIQELMPLYEENLVNEETAAYIEEHLCKCTDCREQWENFISPLPDPLLGEKLKIQKSSDHKLINRIKKTVLVGVLLLVMGGTGLAYASYTAGKHVGQDDPSYRFAQELGLFTEINQSKTIDGIQVNLENGLFDSTRSVLFLNFSSPVQDVPMITMTDEEGTEYLQKSSKGWQNKYFMFELEPLDVDTQSINISLALRDMAGRDVADTGNMEETAEFTVPVDILKTAQHTKIIYPNQEKDLAELKVRLEKAVLGVSESEFQVRFDWPVDGTVAGLGIGRGTAYFPTSVREVPDTPPPPGAIPPPGGLTSGYAASYVVNYHQGDLPDNRPALYDLTARREVEVQRGEYQTTQFPCQVTASLKFAPVEQESQKLDMLLPPLYLYKKTADSLDSIKWELNFQEKNELNLEKSIPYQDGNIILEKVWREDDRIYLSFRLESFASTNNILPHFELTDSEGMKLGEMHFDRDNPMVVMFYLYHEEVKKLFLNLDSIGHMLPREEFTLEIA